MWHQTEIIAMKWVKERTIKANKTSANRFIARATLHIFFFVHYVHRFFFDSFAFIICLHINGRWNKISRKLNNEIFITHLMRFIYTTVECSRVFLHLVFIIDGFYVSQNKEICLRALKIILILFWFWLFSFQLFNEANKWCENYF